MAQRSRGLLFSISCGTSAGFSGDWCRLCRAWPVLAVRCLDNARGHLGCFSMLGVGATNALHHYHSAGLETRDINANLPPCATEQFGFHAVLTLAAAGHHTRSARWFGLFSSGGDGGLDFF